MNELAKTWYEREFKLHFLERRGVAFQDLFAEIMEAAHPTDFQRVRPYGNQGDWKCDGYLLSEGVVFQVYAPDDMRNASRLVRKMEADFRGAVERWGPRLSTWVLVHNDRRGLPPQGLSKLLELRDEAAGMGVEVAQWSFEELRLQTTRLDLGCLAAIFGPAPVREREGRGFIHRKQSRRYLRWLLSGGPPEFQRYLGTDGIDNFPLQIEVSDRRPRRRGAPSWSRPGSPKEVTVGELRYLFRKKRHLLLQGAPGSGKSSLLQVFALHEAWRRTQHPGNLLTGLLPVLLPLRQFNDRTDLFSFALAQFLESGVGVAPVQFESALERGWVVLLADGLDEVSPQLRQTCRHRLVELCRRFPKNHLLVASRPESTSAEELPGFCELQVAALRPGRGAGVYLASRRITESSFQKQHGCTAAQFLKRLGIPQTPLTLSLLGRVAESGGLGHGLFSIYEQITEGLVSPLPPQARTVAKQIASELAHEATTGGAALSRQELSRRLASATGDHIVDASEIARVLFEREILQEEGGLNIRFRHNLLQEYFCAVRILEVGPPFSLHSKDSLGAARFLCAAVEDPAPVFRAALATGASAREILPLLEEAAASSQLEGIWLDLLDQIHFAGEWFGVHLNYGMQDELPGLGVDLENLIDVCKELGPWTTELLLDAAYSIVMSVLTDFSQGWLTQVVDALVQFEWEGAEVLRGFASCGYYDPNRLAELPDEEEEDLSSEVIPEFMYAVHEGDLKSARRLLAEIDALFGEPPRPHPDQIGLFPDLES